MISMKIVQRGLAALLAFCLVGVGPTWGEEQRGSFSQLPQRGGGSAHAVPRVDLRAAARAFVLADTGVASPALPNGLGSVGQAAAKPAPAARPQSEKKAAIASTVPPTAPRTTRTHKIAAYTAIAVLAAVAAVVVAKEVRHEDPVLTPGTPTRIQ